MIKEGKEDICIRHARKEDYQKVEEIMEQVQALHVGWRPDIYRPVETVFPVELFEEDRQQGTLFVAEWKGEVTGVLEISYRRVMSPIHVERNILFIDTMAVKDGYRGRGIGHAFFDFVKKLKTERMLDGIELQVNGKNQAAIQMYESCGLTVKSINMELLEER